MFGVDERGIEEGGVLLDCFGIGFFGEGVEGCGFGLNRGGEGGEEVFCFREEARLEVDMV